MERLIVLVSVVTLFSIFFVLQISRLFGNSGGLAGSGITYAQAAHEGFGELTIAASLCATLLIGLAAGSIGGVRSRTERALSAVLILQAQLLLLSAYHRLEIYEDVYGFTELRLYVQCYTGVVFVALGQLALEILGDLTFDALPDTGRLPSSSRLPHWCIGIMRRGSPVQTSNDTKRGTSSTLGICSSRWGLMRYPRSSASRLACQLLRRPVCEHACKAGIHRHPV